MTGPAGTKSDRIVDELRRRILDGALARGTRLPQDELAREFGASITPVREALGRLAAEGLVVAEQNRGVRVAGVDLEQVTATYVLRRLAEPYAVRRATSRVSRRDLARARDLLAPVRDDPAADRERNRAFHFVFYDRCEMPALTDRIAAMWRAFPWDLTLHTAGRSAAAHVEHTEILDAVASGDPDRAAAAVERHIARRFRSVLDRLGAPAGLDPFDPEAG